ncbi:hypothetical protein MNBD_PLANCTO02-319 [hydrothermal vent metagenome]|uniref:Aerotolerance regulator N-terminal domain-containing protein n=1 Tax=hydrothermal vent metagenome TaxID=652676 RepID=A0A3B1DCZ6_9ZZZZ
MGPSIFSQLFLNPAFVTVGSLVAIVATPVIIHFINRLRYRKVRFAAMEFLLQSDKQNRQRVLLEQLLLLLLRILIVLALLALIARMIFSQTTFKNLGGAKAHHLVLLDDSGSMRQKWNETSAFKEGIKTIKSMVTEGAKRPNTRTLSLVLLSNPNQPLVSNADINEVLIKELESKLNNLECSHRSLNLVKGLDIAGEILANSKGTSKTLHVISDFRSDDWKNRSAIADSVAELDDAKISVNLVRSLPYKEGDVANLAITNLSGDTQSAKPGIPVEFRMRVFNYSKVVVKNVRADIFQDGKKNPGKTPPIPEIPPNSSVESKFYVTYQEAGNHTLKLALESDALDLDNQRFVAINIKVKHEILIIDGDEKVFSRDKDVMTTGKSVNSSLFLIYSSVIKDVNYLRNQPLDHYQSIYMLNVAELSPDALDALTEYVKGGGGLVWFMGDQINSKYYNEHLYKPLGKGLFPVPLQNKPKQMPENANPELESDLKAGDHPILKDYKKIPGLGKAFSISTFLPVENKWERDDTVRKDGVTTFASTRTNAPLMFLHNLGDGKIITVLTSGGTMWTTLSSTYAYPLIMLNIQKYVNKNEDADNSRIVGSAIDLSLDPSQYTEKVEIVTPGKGASPRSNRLDARFIKGKAAEKPKEGEEPSPATKPQLVLNFGSKSTDRPGIYTVKLSKTGNNDTYGEEKMLAFNIPDSESSLPIISNSKIVDRVGKEVKVTIQEFGSTDWIKEKDAGQEARRLLLILIVILFLAEQALAYRLSFHASGSSRTNKSKLAGPARAAV